MSEQKNDYRALMTKALMEIKELKSELHASKKRESEAIAIVGASCRFPGGANDLDSFWDILKNGRDVISEVPPDRWSADAFYDPDPDAPGKICTKLGGFLSQPVGEFDARFFGISPREAESMDPQQRLLMELCWEALENANMVPGELFKSNIGVFMGISSLDNATRIIGEAPATDIDGYYGTGIALAPVAGRISYYFGFTGPSFVVDTACSSSLLSLHLACESLRRRECNMALGGGMQLLTHPGVSIAFTKAHMLSVDGRCRTFDSGANGYARGEGGGVMVLKRLSDAQADGNTILGVIRGSAVNQDGSSGGLTVPSGPSQEGVIRQAMSNGNVDPSHVNYIEAHGTGTPLGDPIEIGALASVFGDFRSAKDPLRVGSVKTNMGHLEAGAGIASAIKVMLSLRHRTIVPHLNFDQPNPLIPWNEIPIDVPVKAREWQPVAPEVPLTAGISSFGFSGTNVHLVMSEAPTEVSTEPAVTENEHGENQLLVLSAQNLPALRELALRYVTLLKNADEKEWSSIVYTAAVARTRFKHRLAIISTNAAHAAIQLEEFVSGVNASDGAAGEWTYGLCDEGSRPKTALLFTGQGSQYSGMGKELYENESVFRGIIDRCDQIMRPYIGQPLADLLFKGGERLNETGFTQPALYALEVALAELWRSKGGRIDAVTGHSVGEYAAATIAGVFSIEDGARLISERAKLMQALPEGGGMLVLFETQSRVEQLIENWNLDDINIAALNGPSNIVLSGSLSSLSQVGKKLDKEKIDYKSLSVSHAFHSSLMEPVLKPFREVAESLQYNKPGIPVYSNLTGRPAEGLMADADYWVRHIREPVLFETAIKSMLNDGFDLFVEAGPKGTLLALGKRIAEDFYISDAETKLPADQNTWISMLKPGRNESKQVSKALGSYWTRGGESVIENFTGKNLKISKPHLGLSQLPTYPFQRKRYWRDVKIDGNQLRNKEKTDKSTGQKELEHPLLGRFFKSPLVNDRFYETRFSKAEIPMLDEHRIFGELVVAGASHLALIVGAAEMEFHNKELILSDIVFPQALVLSENGERNVQLMLTPDSKGSGRSFRLVSFSDQNRDVAVHATGRMEPGHKKLNEHKEGVQTFQDHTSEELNALENRCKRKVNVENVYKVQEQRHIVVGESYKWLKSMKLGDGEAVAELVQPQSLSHSTDFSLHPGLIDSCFGVLVMTSEISVEETFIPVGMEAMHIYKSASNKPLKVFARLRSGNADHSHMVGDIIIETQSGERVAAFIGLEGRKAGKEALLALSASDNNMLYERVWENLEVTDRQPESDETWLIFCDKTGFAKSVAESWRRIGRKVIEIQAGDSFTCTDKDHWTMNPKDFSQIRELTDQIRQSFTDENITEEGLPGKKLTGIINFWPLDTSYEDGDYIESTQKESVEFILSLIKELSEQPLSNRMIVATRHACFISKDQELTNPYHASIWGLMKSIMTELPDLNPAVIDIGQSDLSDRSTVKVFTDAVYKTFEGETGLACRDTGIYTERLRPFNPDRNSELEFDVESPILITGGTGELGLTLAEWLVNKGVRSLILLGRNDPGAAKIKVIESMRSAGADVHLLKADVADYKALSTVIAQNKELFKNLKGVFHLAGVLSDGPVTKMDWTQFYKPFSSKVLGAINLHRLTSGYPLEHFVLFSSMASLIGSVGQGNYAAANAVMDALAEKRRSSGLCGLSINWGPWKESGMAASLDEVSRRRLEDRGISFMSNDVAMGHLETVLNYEVPAQVAIADVDWNRYAAGSVSILKDLVNNPDKIEDAVSADEAVPGLLNKLENCSSDRRESLLQKELTQMISVGLKMQKGQGIDPRERLFDLGVDSLIAIELKNKLQRELGVHVSSTLLFDYPTVEALVKYILHDLLNSAFELTKVEKKNGSTGIGFTDHSIHEMDEDMSDDDAEAALLEELSRLKGGG